MMASLLLAESLLGRMLCKAVAELVDYCNNHNKKIIHISTDYIYANSFQNADEEITVPAQIETWYGYTKLLGDAYVQLKSKN